MAAQANLKSAAITNLDATPPVRPSAGREGGVDRLYTVVGKAGPTTDAATTGGILRMVRIPSNACVKSIMYAQDADTTTASFDCGLYFSDAADGTSVSNQGLVSDADCFATAVDTHAVHSWTEIAFEATTYKPSDTLNPIWQLSSLVDGAGNAMTTDPGGFFDIVLVNKATISGAATLLLKVEYSLPAP